MTNKSSMSSPKLLPRNRSHRRTIANRSGGEKGIALLLVIFTITLLSILSIALTQSTYIGSQLHRSFVDRFRAELLLRSALNVALELIAQDSGTVDPPKDSWGPFIPGQTVPASLLGISDPRLEIGLEITPENSRLPLFQVKQKAGSTTSQWRDKLAELFRLLNCDDDGESDHTGLFGNRNFFSHDMVANLVDYLDDDQTSLSVGNFKGIESELPEGYFPEKEPKSLTIQELVAIPGFTPNRLRRIEPYLTPLNEVLTVNINVAAPIVLRAIANINEQEAATLAEFARGPDGPFSDQNQKGESLLSQLIPNYSDLNVAFLTKRTTTLQIIAKVQFGDRRFFARSRVKRDSGQPPTVISTEFFG
jgi:type II secretory pathway component PulK